MRGTSGGTSRGSSGGFSSNEAGGIAGRGHSGGEETATSRSQEMPTIHAGSDARALHIRWSPNQKFNAMDGNAAKLYPLQAEEEQRNRDKNVPGSKVLFGLNWAALNEALPHVASDIFESLDLS